MEWGVEIMIQFGVWKEFLSRGLPFIIHYYYSRAQEWEWLNDLA